ncbi:small ribosomal subunit protein uS9m-like [Crassostrea virginica]
MAASIPSAAKLFVRRTGREFGYCCNRRVASLFFTRTLRTGKTDTKLVTEEVTDKVIEPQRRAEKISAAMKAFLKRAKEHESKINTYKEEYELGRKHLANMMGIPEEEMTQEHVDEAIQYLFPSGLFDKSSRPKFKHPKDILPTQFEFPFDKSGRPHHYQYFTLLPNYFGAMSEAAWRTECLKEEEVRIGSTGLPPKEEMKYLEEEYEWMDFQKFVHYFRTKHNEVVKENEHKRFLIVMEKLSKMRLREQDLNFLKQFGSPTTEDIKVLDSEELRVFHVDAEGRKFRTKNGYRKTAVAQVTVYDAGSGKFEINGQGVDYFESKYAREQILFPLVLTDTLDKVDVSVQVQGGGEIGQSGAIRHGLSNALLPFISQQMVNKLSLAGLLDRDVRVKERKKPGQKKARKQFQWRAR